MIEHTLEELADKCLPQEVQELQQTLRRAATELRALRAERDCARESLTASRTYNVQLEEQILAVRQHHKLADLDEIARIIGCTRLLVGSTVQAWSKQIDQLSLDNRHQLAQLEQLRSDLSTALERLEAARYYNTQLEGKQRTLTEDVNAANEDLEKMAQVLACPGTSVVQAVQAWGKQLAQLEQLLGCRGWEVCDGASRWQHVCEMIERLKQEKAALLQRLSRISEIAG